MFASLSHVSSAALLQVQRGLREVPKFSGDFWALWHWDWPLCGANCSKVRALECFKIVLGEVWAISLDHGRATRHCFGESGAGCPPYWESLWCKEFRRKGQIHFFCFLFTPAREMVQPLVSTMPRVPFFTIPNGVAPLSRPLKLY